MGTLHFRESSTKCLFADQVSGSQTGSVTPLRSWESLLMRVSPSRGVGQGPDVFPTRPGRRVTETVYRTKYTFTLLVDFHDGRPVTGGTLSRRRWDPTPAGRSFE